MKLEQMNKDNINYVRNHALIVDTTYELQQTLGRTPLFREISEATGLHYSTIQRHFAQIKNEDIKPKYQKYIFEVIDRHLELMRQNENLPVALNAVLSFEERIFDLVPKQEINVKNVETKKLVIEIEDRRQQLENKMEVVSEN